MSSFAIGSRTWPGLSKLAEEAGEVIQVIGKLMGTGGLEDHWDGTNLRIRLEEEIADLCAALEFVKRHCNLDPSLWHRTRSKLELFEKWHECGDPAESVDDDG